MTKEAKGQRSIGTDLVSATDEALWRAYVAAHKNLAMIEHVEQRVAGMKAAEVAQSQHYTKELATIEQIERLVAELKAALAARSDGIVQEAHRRG